MKKTALLALLFATPLVSFAQGQPGNLTPLKQLVYSVGEIVSMLIPILIAVGLIVFFWGLIRYIWNRDETGKSIMWWGLIALFVMVSVWGIIRLAQNALGVGSVNTIQAPRFPQ